MPKKTRWTYTAARTTADGCTLTVTATAASSDSFAWVVIVAGDGAGQHIANGASPTMAEAMEQADAAARRHAAAQEEASRQLSLL